MSVVLSIQSFAALWNSIEWLNQISSPNHLSQVPKKFTKSTNYAGFMLKKQQLLIKTTILHHTATTTTLAVKTWYFTTCLFQVNVYEIMRQISIILISKYRFLSFVCDPVFKQHRCQRRSAVMLLEKSAVLNKLDTHIKSFSIIKVNNLYRFISRRSLGDNIYSKKWFQLYTQKQTNKNILPGYISNPWNKMYNISVNIFTHSTLSYSKNVYIRKLKTKNNNKETWSLLVKSTRCLLGHSIQGYTRRKSS